MMAVMIPWTHKCVYLLCTYCIPTVYLLYTDRVPTVYLTCTYCIPTVYLLYTDRVPTVYLMCTYCVPTVYLLCTYCVQTVYRFLYFILFFHCSLINVELLERKYYSCDQMRRNEMAGACGMCRGAERCLQGFGEET
jgi:hypothetical protein